MGTVISTRTIVTLSALLVLAASSQAADDLQLQLIKLVNAGRKCEQVPNNGLLCTFKVENGPTLSIKDVGGTDTVVGFQHSDISERFYAVGYFGCVVVVPGHAHPPGYERTYAAFISPKTGNVYASREECEVAR